MSQKTRRADFARESTPAKKATGGVPSGCPLRSCHPWRLCRGAGPYNRLLQLPVRLSPAPFNSSLFLNLAQWHETCRSICGESVEEMHIHSRDEAFEAFGRKAAHDRICLFCRSLYNTIIIVRILLTWFPNPPQVIAAPLRFAHHFWYLECVIPDVS